MSYIRHQYFFYVTGLIPDGKIVTEVDERIIEKYNISLSKYARFRRRRRGEASVQYLRYGRFFVILATEGEHPFFVAEKNVRDVRREPLKFAGYSIGLGREKGCGKWHVSVRIEKRDFRLILRNFAAAALSHSDAELLRALRALPFERYAPVRRQIFQIVRHINRIRTGRGLLPVDRGKLDFKRRPVRPFGDSESRS